MPTSSCKPKDCLAASKSAAHDRLVECRTMTPTIFARDVVENLVITCEEILLDRPKRRQTASGRMGVAIWLALGGPLALVYQGVSQTRRPAFVVIVVLALVGLLINGNAQLISADLLRQLNAGWWALTV